VPAPSPEPEAPMLIPEHPRSRSISKKEAIRKLNRIIDNPNATDDSAIYLHNTALKELLGEKIANGHFSLITRLMDRRGQLTLDNTINNIKDLLNTIYITDVPKVAGGVYIDTLYNQLFTENN